MRGGVSAWVDWLMRGQPHLRFSMVSIWPLAADQVPAYERPPNLIDLRGKAAKESWNRVLADLAAGDAWSASTLGDLGPAAVEAVPALVAATSSPNSSLRRAAIEALGKIGGSSDAVKTALDAARKDPDVRLRRAAYESQALLGLLPK